MKLDGSTVVTAAPFVEVELCYEPPGEPGTKVSGRGWCALRLETKNNVYDLEWSMRCFQVRDKKHGSLIPNHKLLGAQLTGGQLRANQKLELTYPLPRPGVSAVFELPGGRHEYITTSEVTRVVLRMRVIGVGEESQARPQWKELSDSFAPTLAAGSNTKPGH
ncbi:MAG: hypothetical protein AB8I08_04255 [Sandaracinaceae bacterium]